MIDFEPAKQIEVRKIRFMVVGLGTSGNKAIGRMLDDGLGDVEYLGINTNAQDLKLCRADGILRIGDSVTGGLGAGADPQRGEAAALENYRDIQKALRGVDMVFLTCGLGGGTGSGAAWVVAKAAREMGCLTIAVVTTPFAHESAKRRKNAEEGLEKLRKNADSYIVIPNESLSYVTDKKTGFIMADNVLMQTVRGISTMIRETRISNIDFADIKTLFQNKGRAHFGIGSATGEDKGMRAVKNALDNPLVDSALANATCVLINFGGKPFLSDIKAGCEYLLSVTGSEISMFYSVETDSESEADQCVVTIFATENRETDRKN